MPLLALCSCSGFVGKLLVMEGNFYYTRGQSNDAITAYLKATTYMEVKPYAEFGLGVIYYSLDEPDAALFRLDKAKEAAQNETGHTELLYRIHYNAGVIHFEEGDYNKAVSDFKQALETEGSHIEAKRNLELSLLFQSRNENTSENSAGKNEVREGARTEALFDYLRQKESSQWRSREWTEDTSISELDY
jgi:Ca-activated chloride channel family protein